MGQHFSLLKQRYILLFMLDCQESTTCISNFARVKMLFQLSNVNGYYHINRHKKKNIYINRLFLWHKQSIWAGRRNKTLNISGQLKSYFLCSYWFLLCIFEHWMISVKVLWLRIITKLNFIVIIITVKSNTYIAHVSKNLCKDVRKKGEEPKENPEKKYLEI